MEDILLYLLAGAGIIILLLLLLMQILTRKKLKKFVVKYNRFMSSFGEKNIEELLEACLKKIKDDEKDIITNRDDIAALNKLLMRCVQKVGIIRYNAFEKVGSNLSYSVAMLDRFNSGLVLTGLYSRDSSSTFVKPVEEGKSSFTLSDEEKDAIEKALYK